MPNYFDYINDGAEKYDEPDFMEESVNDTFNDTIADMDLYCFQESLLVGAIVVGALALIGILIAILSKILKGSSSSAGLKTQTKKAEKALDSLKKKGITEIRTGSAATETINNAKSKQSEEESTPTPSTSKNNVVVIEDVICDRRSNVLNMINIRGDKFSGAIDKIGRFISGTLLYFDYAIQKKGGSADNAKHMPDKFRTGREDPDYTGFKYDEIFEPLNLPTIQECCIDREVKSIDALRQEVEDVKTILIPVIAENIDKLKKKERELKKVGENKDRIFKNKAFESKYRKNTGSMDKFYVSTKAIIDRNVIRLEEYNGSARFVGVA